MIRTVMLLRRCAIRFPARDVPNVVEPTPRESSASLVLSTVPAASTTAQFGGITSVLGIPSLTKSRLLIVLPLKLSRTT